MLVDQLATPLIHGEHGRFSIRPILVIRKAAAA
jgi:hypothetical protein